ncbi:polymerase [Rheinheimera mesophila]|nr:polymerase [Rheinheimera mesophila]
MPVTQTNLTIDVLKEQLQQAGYGRCLLLQDQIKNLLLEYQQIQQKIKQQLQAEGYVLKYKVAQRVHAQLKIEISSDAMHATAEITAAYGGNPVSANDAVKAGQEAGIVFGFQKEQILQLVAQASRAEPGSKIKAEIAVGRLPVPGRDSVFELLIRDMSNRNKQPVARSEGKVDLRDFGAIASVKTGEALMRRLPPTKGKEGMTVTGTRLSALDGQQLPWGAAEGSEISPANPDLLIASKDGMPRLMDASVAVDEVFVINKVDAGSGHIIFKGAVVINGDVAAAMKVIAGGNVFVKGLFEGDLIESGGDITIGGAIIGHQIGEVSEHTELSTQLRAKGHIHCTLAQYAALKCEGRLTVSKQLLHCQVEADSVLAGTEEKANGKIVGGRYYLGNGLRCGNLGAPSGSLLQIILNKQMDPLIEKQTVLRASLASLKAEMELVKQHVEQLKQMEKSAAVQEQMAAMVEEFEEHRSIAAAFIADIKQLEEQRRQLLLSVCVEVTQQLFAGVESSFGNEVLRTKKEYGPSRIRLSEQGVVVEAL